MNNENNLWKESRWQEKRHPANDPEGSLRASGVEERKKRLRQRQATEDLQVTERHVRRMLVKIKECGNRSIVHGLPAGGASTGSWPRRWARVCRKDSLAERPAGIWTNAPNSCHAQGTRAFLRCQPSAPLSPCY